MIGPIEKGAIDGQTTFGNELVKALKAILSPRGRAHGKAGKSKGRRKRDAAGQEVSATSAKDAASSGADIAGSGGIFGALQGIVEAVSSIAKPLWSPNVVVLLICLLVFMVFFRGSTSPMGAHDIGCPGYTLPQRLAAYEEMWRREESELWTWLEDRVGMEGMVFPTAWKQSEFQSRHTQHRKVQGERELAGKLHEDKLSDREMNYAIRTTRERLDTLEDILKERKTQWTESTHQEL